MFCSECGAKNEKGVIFCSECGKKIGNNKNEKNNTSKTNKSFGDLVKENKILCAIIILLIAFFGYKLMNSNKLVCKQTYENKSATIEIRYSGDEPTKIKLKTSDGDVNETITVKDGIGYDSNGDESDYNEYSTIEKIMKSNKQAAKAYLREEGYECK